MAALAAPAAAANTISAADIPSVTKALEAAGHRTALRRDDAGVRYILVDEGEEEFSVGFDDCEDNVEATGCNMLIFNAVWDGDSEADADVVNDFNRAATLAHAFLDAEDGTLNLTLAVTTKGGLPAANFAEIIAIWEASDADLAELLGGDEAQPGVVVAALSAR
jgi:hypothetical protein